MHTNQSPEKLPEREFAQLIRELELRRKLWVIQGKVEVLSKVPITTLKRLEALLDLQIYGYAVYELPHYISRRANARAEEFGEHIQQLCLSRKKHLQQIT